MAFKVSCYAKFKEIFSDETFDSFDEFNEKFQKFQEETFSVYRVLDSNKVETENVRRKAKLDLCLKYSSVSFCCVHYGQEKPRGNGIRVKQKLLPQNCPSFLRLSASARDQQLRIIYANMTHNHVVSSDLYKSYRQNRLLSKEEVAEVAPLLSSGDIPNQEVKKIVEKKFGKTLKGKDVINLKGKVKKGGSEQMGPTLKDMLEDGQAKLVNDEETNQLQIIALATNEMGLLFERFPEAIFIDVRIRPNKHNFYLCQVVVEDEMKRGRTILYVFVRNKTKETVVTVLRVFLERYPNANLVKTVVLGAGFPQLQQVQQMFPTSRILWCQFRVLRISKKRIDRLPITFTKKRELFIGVRDAIMSKDESAFLAAMEDVKGTDPGFFNYFQEEWLPSMELWASFERRGAPTVTNKTNLVNNEMLRRSVAASSSMVDVVQALVDNKDFLDNCASSYSLICAKPPNFSKNVTKLLKLYTDSDAALIQKNLEKLKCLAMAGEEQEENLHVVNENKEQYIVRIENQVLDCNCTFHAIYDLPCRHIVYACENFKPKAVVKVSNAVQTIEEDSIVPDMEEDSIVPIVEEISLPVYELYEEPEPEVCEVYIEELSMEEKFQMITEVTRRMNQVLGRLGTFNFQKWMKVLQELKTNIERELLESCADDGSCT